MISESEWKLLCIVKCIIVLLVSLIGMNFVEARRHEHYPTHQCYVCSYFAESNEEWSRKECIEHPQQLTTIQCNISSYCYYQEMYDPNTDEITSFVRSCMRQPSRNTCVQDATRITCEYTCQGDYCNRNATGHTHEEFLKSGQQYSVSDTFVTSALVMVNVYFALT